MRFINVLALVSLFGGFTGAAQAEDVINAVHFTPAQNGYAKSFLKFVEKVNEKGKGVVKIVVRGGPEVIPYPQLGTAQKSGLIDMINAPAGAYLEMVPEGEVFSASTLTPWEARKDGGWDFVNKIYEKKGNAHLLAHIDAGTGFHMFTVDKPEMKPDGAIDFTKLKIRASPLYRQFFENLGATVIVQNATDVYTSLERGVINANAYPIMGYPSFGWDKFTKYRIDPSFFQVDVLVSMNKKKWDSLSPESKKILDEVSVQYEKESFDANKLETDRIAKEMIDHGQQVVEMTGEGREKFLATAAKASWERMEQRDPANIAELHKYFPK